MLRLTHLDLVIVNGRYYEGCKQQIGPVSCEEALTLIWPR